MLSSKVSKVGLIKGENRSIHNDTAKVVVNCKAAARIFIIKDRITWY